MACVAGNHPSVTRSRAGGGAEYDPEQSRRADSLRKLTTALGYSMTMCTWNGSRGGSYRAVACTLYGKFTRGGAQPARCVSVWDMIVN